MIFGVKQEAAVPKVKVGAATILATMGNTMRIMYGCIAAVALFMAGLSGCGRESYIPATSLVRVSNMEPKKHPVRLNDPDIGEKDRMVLIEDPASWSAYWGQDEAPPVVDFTKYVVLVAVSWMASSGPGSLEVRIVGYRDDKKAGTRTVIVKDIVSGTWDSPGGLSRAYDIARIPRSNLKLVLDWRKSTPQGVNHTQEEPVPFTVGP